MPTNEELRQELRRRIQLMEQLEARGELTPELQKQLNAARKVDLNPPIDPAGLPPGATIPEPITPGQVPGLIPRGVSPGELLPTPAPGFPLAPGILPPSAAADPQFQRRLRGSAQDVQEALRRNIPQGARPATIMAGETIGGAIGAAGGTALGGPIGGTVGFAGGVAGGGAGASFAFDSLNDLLRFAGQAQLPGGTPEGGTPGETMVNRIIRAGEEAQMSLGFGVAGSAVFPIARMAAPGLGKIFGVRGDPVRQLTARAERAGIGLGAVDVGNIVPRSIAKLLGIFPFTGTPLRKARSAKEAQLRSKTDFILNEIAPTASTAELLGIDIAQAASNTKEAFDFAAAQLYNPMRFIMQNIRTADGELIPFIRTSTAKGTIQRHLDEARLRDTPKQRQPGEPQEFIEAPGDDLRAWLEENAEIADEMTYDQWSGLQEKMQKLANKGNLSGNDMRRLSEIKQAHELDLNNFDRGAENMMRNMGVDEDQIVQNLEQMTKARTMKDDADAFFQAGIVHFQTKEAQRIARQSPNIFRPGPDIPGTLNEDELLKSVFNADSPIGLRNLRNLVGDDVFRSAARAHIDDAIEASVKTEKQANKEVEILDLDTLANKLGLSKGLKDRRAALQEMLRGTGIDVQDVEDIVTSARILKVQDPSQFVTRRVTLGGAAALGAIGGLGGVAAQKGVSIADALIITFLSRQGASILASPKSLKVLQNSLDPTLDEVQRRSMLLRLVKAVGQTPEGEEAAQQAIQEGETRIRDLIPQRPGFLDRGQEQGVQ